MNKLKKFAIQTIVVLIMVAGWAALGKLVSDITNTENRPAMEVCQLTHSYEVCHNTLYN